MSSRSADDAVWTRRVEAITGAIDGGQRASVNQIAAATVDPDPYRVLISTLISLRTRDEVTFAASDRLLSEASTPYAMANLTEARISDLIYPAGFYRTKAKTIRTVSELLITDHGGTVPRTVAELTALPGVGRKTANLVLAIGHGIDAICVDIHVHRISNRNGWVATKDPDGTERALMDVLPRRYWIPINEWLVRFGQTVCTPQSPHCSICPLREECLRVGVTRHR